MDFTAEFDQITMDELIAHGSAKWAKQPGAIGAWIAEMDFPLAEPISQAITDLVQAGALAYSPPGDEPALASAYTQFATRRYGWAPPVEWVHPVPDVLIALQSVIEHYTRADSPIIVPTPAYMPFLTLPGYSNREVIQVPLVRSHDRWVYDLDALAAAFATGAQLLVLCNPHNPVGRVLERAELAAIADVVERAGGLVFSDEIHAPLVYSGAEHVPYASLDERTAGHTITATSASKTFNIPGLKCAQICFTNPEHEARWERAGRWLGASRPGIFANIAAYTHGEPWLSGVLAYLDRNRRALAGLLSQRLPGVGYDQPEGTYLTLLDFRPLGDQRLGDDPAEFFAREAAVVLTPGLACGEAGRGLARLNFGTPLPVLETIIDRMATSLA